MYRIMLSENLVSTSSFKNTDAFSVFLGKALLLIYFIQYYCIFTGLLRLFLFVFWQHFFEGIGTYYLNHQICGHGIIHSIFSYLFNVPGINSDDLFLVALIYTSLYSQSFLISWLGWLEASNFIDLKEPAFDFADFLYCFQFPFFCLILTSSYLFLALVSSLSILCDFQKCERFSSQHINYT